MTQPKMCRMCRNHSLHYNQCTHSWYISKALSTLHTYVRSVQNEQKYVHEWMQMELKKRKILDGSVERIGLKNGQSASVCIRLHPFHSDPLINENWYFLSAHAQCRWLDQFERITMDVKSNRSIRHRLQCKIQTDDTQKKSVHFEWTKK